MTRRNSLQSLPFAETQTGSPPGNFCRWALGEVGTNGRRARPGRRTLEISIPHCHHSPPPPPPGAVKTGAAQTHRVNLQRPSESAAVDWLRLPGQGKQETPVTEQQLQRQPAMACRLFVTVRILFSSVRSINTGLAVHVYRSRLPWIRLFTGRHQSKKKSWPCARCWCWRAVVLSILVPSRRVPLRTLHHNTSDPCPLFGDFGTHYSGRLFLFSAFPFFPDWARDGHLNSTTHRLAQSRVFSYAGGTNSPFKILVWRHCIAYAQSSAHTTKVSVWPIEPSPDQAVLPYLQDEKSLRHLGVRLASGEAVGEPGYNHPAGPGRGRGRGRVHVFTPLGLSLPKSIRYPR
ncbi:hypothetical protein LY76DRAFT_206784 [Colletotrichum caudatum]|nr:hypothetical protein LY76DRAFT_206784 [Colletotrichum caudatum]